LEYRGGFCHRLRNCLNLLKLCLEYCGLFFLQILCIFCCFYLDTSGDGEVADYMIIACVQLLRVGVDEFRYVAVAAAVCWLITIDKNIKGRGHRPSDSQVVLLCFVIEVKSMQYFSFCLCYCSDLK